MTAEIAILNKTVVALATDSAVTITMGNKEEKVFDSADKLFEISNSEPIGLMLYSGMEFAEVPFPLLVKQFRDECQEFDTVKEYCDSFLQFLNLTAKKSSPEVQDRILANSVEAIVSEILDTMQNVYFDLSRRQAGEPIEESSFDKVAISIVDKFEEIISNYEEAKFVGCETPPKLNDGEKNLINEIISRDFSSSKGELIERIYDVCELTLTKNYFGQIRTGLVFAGFGRKEQFPTLHSFEIAGVINGHLRYCITEECDIDRDGALSRVIPFAQKQMVDRFLYGLDDSIKENIERYCLSGIKLIQENFLNQFSFENQDDREASNAELIAAGNSFIEGLRIDAFNAIQNDARQEIDNMVAFMPKSEISKMAEALIELTSIKHRISKGMETVGGPVDVAVISRSEGFVWIKRKHYFPADINSRYFERLKIKMSNSMKENGNGGS